MAMIEVLDYIETSKSGFDYPSESRTEEVDCEISSAWLDDFGWV